MDSSARLGKVPYYTPQMDKIATKLGRIADISDNEIVLSSIAKTEQDSKKSLAAKMSKALVPATIGAFILTDVAKAKIKSGDIVKKAPPSVKLAVGLASLISWLATFGFFSIANKASSKIADKTDNANLKSGILLAGTVGGGAGLYLAARELATKSIKKFTKNMPETVKELGVKAAKFDEGFRANNIVKAIKKNIGDPISRFASKHSNLSKFLSRNSSLIIFGLSILGSVLIGTKITKDKNKSFEENVNKLYQIREEARIATDELKASKAVYDDIINDDGFIVDTNEVIETAEIDPKNIDKSAMRTLKAALE